MRDWEHRGVLDDGTKGGLGRRGTNRQLGRSLKEADLVLIGVA